MTSAPRKILDSTQEEIYDWVDRWLYSMTDDARKYFISSIINHPAVKEILEENK